ncbi:MAG TPA: nuclear transport factor 2 family protein [Acidobacteriaceae bacterium]
MAGFLFQASGSGDGWCSAYFLGYFSRARDACKRNDNGTLQTEIDRRAQNGGCLKVNPGTKGRPTEDICMEQAGQEQGSGAEMNPVAEETVVRHLVERINNAWFHRRGAEMREAISDSIAEDVVMRGPGFAFMGKGREFMLDSYRKFAVEAEIRDFSTRHFTGEISGDTAVVQYGWKMVYDLSEGEYTEQGHDLFVFARRQGKWLLVWRVLLDRTV